MNSSTLSEIECKASREQDLKPVFSKNLPFAFATLPTSKVLESNGVYELHTVLSYFVYINMLT